MAGHGESQGNGAGELSGETSQAPHTQTRGDICRPAGPWTTDLLGLFKSPLSPSSSPPPPRAGAGSGAGNGCQKRAAEAPLPSGSLGV